MSSSTPYQPNPGQPTTPCLCPTEPPISASCPVNQKVSPVQLDSGQVSFDVPLLSTGAVGTGAFSLALHYLSGYAGATGSDGAVGTNFNYTQNALLIPSGDDVTLRQGANTQELFRSLGGGAYDASANNTAAVLTRTGAGTPADAFTLVSRDGVVSHFSGFDASIPTPGRLRDFTDRFGNAQTLTWQLLGGAAVRLTDLTDSYGRATAFAYYGPELNYALKQVTDYLGRQANFQYDGLGHLTAAIGPAVTRGAGDNANAFPDGTAYVFQYDTANARPERRDDLLKVWYPNQVAPFLDSTRTVNVAGVYASATPRQTFSYYQDPTDAFHYGKVQQVVESATGTGSVGAGAYGYLYLDAGLPANLIDPADPVVSRTVATDRNGNQTACDFNAARMMVHRQVFATRGKNSLEAGSWETWTAYNSHNQPVLVVMPEGNSVVYEYEDEGNTITFGGVPYARRIGLLRSLTRLPGNALGIPSRPGSNGQTQLVERYFHDPLFNQVCASVEARGNPIDASGDYFPPQNGGPAPTDADRGRYATVTTFDYQKDAAAAVQADAALQRQLGLTGSQIGQLLAFVNDQMTATDGTGGLPAGFPLGLGDVNGEGTGAGTGADATHLGNVVKVRHPAVRQLIPVVPGAYAQAVLYDAPAAYYRLDESSGTAARDISGSGNDGAYAGGVTSGRPGAIANDPDTAAGFNSAGHVAAPGSPTLDLAGNHTIECWARWSNTSAVQYLLDKSRGDNGQSQYYLWWLPGSNSLISGWWSDGGYHDHFAGFLPAVGRWYHLAVTADGAAVRFYVDGTLIASVAQGAAAAASGGGVLNVGAERGGGANAFSGDLDEAAVYPAALSADRILAHYQVGSGATPWVWSNQPRQELFTSNLLGQRTTHTDPEGNLTVYVRYPQNDPEGAGQYLVPGLSNKQYGFLKEVHADADPAAVMTLLGPDADLAAFTGSLIPRTNTPGVYQDLVTRFRGGGAGGCAGCAYDPLGNPLSSTDARGNTTTFDRNELGEVWRTTSPAPYHYQTETWYDASRNVTRVDTKDVQVRYASDDPADPAYATFTPSGSDSTANLPTRPGPGGSVRPGWFSSLYVYDLLDNRIGQDADATGSSPSSLVTRYGYDFNQNLILVTKPMGNTAEFDYDERDLKIATRTGGATGSVTVMAYDGNGNLTDVLGSAARGTAEQTLTAVLGDAFNGSSPQTFSGDWVAQNTFDGFDRMVSSTDAAGGIALATFDPGGRTIATQTLGSSRGPTPGDRGGVLNVPLASGSTRYDEAGRAYESQQDVFLDGGSYYGPSPYRGLPSGRPVTHAGGGLSADSTANDHTAAVTLTAGGTSYVLSRSVFDRSGRLTASAADNGALSLFTFDGAGRQLTATDALSNQVRNTFDASGNVVGTTRVERCTISPSIPAEGFASALRYDVLNRLVVLAQQGPDGVLDPTLNTCCVPPATPNQTIFTLYGYDSRNNRTNLVDPKGNTRVWEYDGAGRLLRDTRHLREGGTGPAPAGGTGGGPVTGAVTTRTGYDANSNTVRLVDDNGGTTAWAYDPRDRQSAMTFHDGSTRSYVYDAASDVTGYTDENGSVFVNSFDVLGRKTAVAITPAAGVVGTTAQGFRYDGLGRMTFARDSVGTANADCGFTYDSIGRVLEEQQTYAGDTRYVTHDAWASYPSTGFTFPNGRQTTTGYDALYRKNVVTESADGSSIAAWQFFGGRTATLTLGNGLVCSFMNDAGNRSAVQSGQTTPGWGDATTDHLGYDGSGRLIGKRYFNGTGVLVGFTAAYDAASNKLYERPLHAESRASLYTTDSMDRLVQYQRGVLASGGGSIATPITLPGTDSERGYDLDGLGNWKSTAYTPVGGAAATELRTHNRLNQVTRLGVPPASTPVLYDHGNNTADFAARGDGNIVNDGVRASAFDAFNRLAKVTRVSDGHTVGQYAYDAIGRRVEKVITNGGLAGTSSVETRRFLFQWQQVVEELASVSPSVQYVWGQYVDELVQMNTYTPRGAQLLDAGKYYLLSDLIYRSTALTRSSAVVEVYDTDVNGKTSVYSSSGADDRWFTDDDGACDQSACVYLFTGREYDDETRLYSFRSRFYDPALGRFISRDRILYIAGPNLYNLSNGSPTNSLDPYGHQPARPLPPPTGPQPPGTYNPPLSGPQPPGTYGPAPEKPSPPGSTSPSTLTVLSGPVWWFFFGSGCTHMGSNDIIYPPLGPAPTPDKDAPPPDDDNKKEDCTTPPYNIYLDCEVLEWNHQYNYDDPDAARRSNGAQAIWKPGQGPAAAIKGPCAGTDTSKSYHRVMVWKGRQSGYPGSVVGCKCCSMPRGATKPTLEWRYGVR